MAGGGCTLPGNATVLMPGEGYEGVTSVETAALLSKKALLRPLGSHNPNERAAKMEKKILTTPVSAEDLKDIKIGDIIYLNGSLTTCRDVAHRRVVEEGRESPVDVRGNAIVAAVEVEEIVKAEWRDLGMPETLWNCRVKEFGSLIVSSGSEGRNYFEEKKVEYNQKKDEQIEKICKEAGFIK